MGATTSDVNEQPERSDESERIRRDMAQTRVQMGRTLNELQDRLNPDTLKQQAKDAAYDATIGRVGNMVQNAGESIRQTGNGFVQSIKDNPLPAAIAVLSVGWLFSRARASASTGTTTTFSTEKIGDKAEEMKLRASRAADNAQEQIRCVARQAQVRGREMGQSIQRSFYDNPLAFGLGVVAVGVALGLVFPSTELENEWMGEARDRLASKAQEAAHGALDKVDELAHKAVDKTNEKLESATSAQPDGTRISTT